MIIRKAKNKDINQCLKICKKQYWKKKDFEESIKDKDVVFLIAEKEKVIGYVIGFIVPTKRKEALLHEVHVDKKERGNNIGTKLVKEFCKRIFKKGVKEIYAEIDKELKKFYMKSCKFKKSGRWIEVKKTISSFCQQATKISEQA